MTRVGGDHSSRGKGKKEKNGFAREEVLICQKFFIPNQL